MTDFNSKEEVENTTKYYSEKAIGIATYLGGPLAAGILMRRNFINSGDEDKGKLALYIGIASTLVLFTVLFLLPEELVDKIPRAVIPAIYTGIIYFIVDRLQGENLKAHKENGGLFYSGWKAAGIGLLSSVVLIGFIFGYAYLGQGDFDTNKYDKGIEEFQKNEDQALKLFTLLERDDVQEASNFIHQLGIPIWKKNIEILDELDQIEGLTEEYILQNEILREYCRLRIKSYELIGKAINANTDEYDKEIEALLEEIDKIINQL